ncbi:hypothetical protein HK100_011304 [Physocladia obscura]|uniref:Uncharacterized protein n=1 Tax=Physocladia obscura TaxID=109957 RepID=A0AAD5T2C1_9FUNG|nr:hypothetical protein HK100_011304 [Physocladia obscura]
MIHQKPVKEAARQHQKNKDRAESSGANIPAKARKLSDDGLAQLSLVASQLLTSARESRNNSYSTAPTTKPSVQMRKPDDPIVARNIQDVNNAIYRKKFPSQSDDNLPLVVVVGADLSALYGPIVTAQPPTFYGFIKDEIDAALIAEAVVCGERRALQFTPEPSFVRIVHGTVICIESLSLETKDSNMVLIRLATADDRMAQLSFVCTQFLTTSAQRDHIKTNAPSNNKNNSISRDPHSKSSSFTQYSSSSNVHATAAHSPSGTHKFFVTNNIHPENKQQLAQSSISYTLNHACDYSDPRLILLVSKSPISDLPQAFVNPADIPAQPPTFYGFIKDVIDAMVVAEGASVGALRCLEFTDPQSYLQIMHGIVCCFEVDSAAAFCGRVVVQSNESRWSYPIRQGAFEISMELNTTTATFDKKLIPKTNGLCKKTTIITTTNSRRFMISSYFIPPILPVLKRSAAVLRIPSRMGQFGEFLSRFVHSNVDNNGDSSDESSGGGVSGLGGDDNGGDSVEEAELSVMAPGMLHLWQEKNEPNNSDEAENNLVLSKKPKT